MRAVITSEHLEYLKKIGVSLKKIAESSTKIKSVPNIRNTSKT